MSKIADAEANATSLDGLINDDGLITTLRNGPKPSWQYIVDQVYAQLGYAVAGSFVTGFTYTGIRQVGVDASGNTWIYTGGQQNIPHVVPAGTVPSEPEYFQVSVNSADNVVLDNGENLQQAIDRLNSEIDSIDASGVSNIKGGSVQDFINSRTFSDVSQLISDANISFYEGEVIGVSSKNFENNGYLKMYSVKLLSNHRIDIGDSEWTPDGYVSDGVYFGSSFYASNTDYVIIAIDPKEQKKIPHIGGMIAASKLNVAVLGDSTEAGVGVSGSKPYGEANGWFNGGWSEFFYYNLMSSQRLFNAPNPDSKYYLQSQPNTQLNCPFPNLRLVKSEEPIARFKVINYDRVNTQNFTVYHNLRTADSACTMRVIVQDEATLTVIANEVVDTYTPEVSYSTTHDVDSKIGKTTISLSNGSAKELIVTITDIQTVDRGNGVSVDGTALYLGCTFGAGITLNNLAVSSSTLLEGSAANVGRGIDTSERLALAESLGANCYAIGWGTNDSKVGISTPEEFFNNYNQFIREIREVTPEAPIYVVTAPKGADGSIYENNFVYNQVIREVAEYNGVELIDIEKLFNSVGTFAYADTVHPSEYGYSAKAGAISHAFGVDMPNGDVKSNGMRVIRITENQMAVSNDASGSFVDIFSATAANPVGARTYRATVKLTAAETGDIDSQEYELTLTDNETSIVYTLDTTTIQLGQPVGGTTVTPIALVGVLTPAVDIFDGRDFTIKVRGKNYAMRSSGASHKIIAEWLG